MQESDYKPQASQGKVVEGKPFNIMDYSWTDVTFTILGVPIQGIKHIEYDGIIKKIIK